MGRHETSTEVSLRNFHSKEIDELLAARATLARAEKALDRKNREFFGIPQNIPAPEGWERARFIAVFSGERGECVIAGDDQRAMGVRPPQQGPNGPVASYQWIVRDWNLADD